MAEKPSRIIEPSREVDVRRESDVVVVGGGLADRQPIGNGKASAIFYAAEGVRVEAVIPAMLRQGGGSILNVSSVASIRRGMPDVFIYGISKAAVNALARSLPVERADKKIPVNCVMPGPPSFWCPTTPPT
jgi:NADP-dependent 3-hydroxy acid dehydrogenase YdfG